MTLMASTTEQMEMFGYTAEGAKQEAKKLASGVNTDLTFKEAATTVGSMLPGIGTAMTVAEIEEELKKENPSYGKIALLGGSEVIGLIPGLGTAAKSALRAAAKKIGANKIVDALDVPKPKTESQIIAGEGATGYEGRALDKARELRRRGYTARQIEEMTGRFTTESPGDYIQQQGVKQGEIFKFEIPDKGIIIKQNDGVINYKEATNISPMLVGDMIPTHKKLFEQYPDLKNVKFYIDPNLSKVAYFNPFVGQLDPNTGKRTGAIVFGADYPGINNVNSPQFRETFFHELQHGTQHQDFLKGSLDQLGGNPTGYTKAITARNPYGDTYQEATILKNSKAVKLKDEIIDLFEKEYLEVGATSVSIKTPSAKVAQKMANLMRDLEAQSFKTYLQTASEVEAGAVGFRAIPTSGASQEKMYSEIAKRKKIQTKEEFRRTDKNIYNPGPDSRIEKIFKKITSQFKKMDNIETMRYNEGGVNFAKYALGMDDKLQGFDTFGVKGTYNKGGISVRPEPRPDIVDVSPRAEAGDQNLIKKDNPFPNVKPKPRPDLDKNKGRTYDIYSVEIDGRETNVIEFKDGSRLSIPQIEQMFEGSKSATESTPGKQTTKEIINFLESNNPTREEFVKHFTAKRLNKGGAMMEEQMKMAFMDEGGLKDDGMEKDPVSGNEVPSGSMAKEVRDDIPAQLSEGEYVVPADVVRYYGVKFFEDLRERAKMGLQDMEMNGRIGGEPVPAGGPVNNEELSPEEMQAIQEMMGMAQGGAVNMYKQQQELYTAPNPAIGNPMQMNQGGQVSGYDQAGAVTANQPAPVPAPPVTSASVEQDMLQAGAAAQQSNFGGFPLGATIFPSEATGKTVLETMAEPTPQTITLYSPDYLTDKQTITVTLPAQDALYQEKMAEGWTTEPPVAAPSSGGGGGGGGGGEDPPKTDPNAWAKGLSAGNSMEWVKANLSGKKTGSGFLNNIGLTQNYARSAALANIAEAQGNTALANQIRGEMKTVYDNSQFIRMMPGEFIDGSSIQGKLGDTIDLSIKKSDPLAGYKQKNPKIVNTEQSKVESGYKKKKKKKGGGFSITATPSNSNQSQTIDVSAAQAATIDQSASAIDAQDADSFEDLNKGGLMTKGKKK